MALLGRFRFDADDHEATVERLVVVSMILLWIWILAREVFFKWATDGMREELLDVCDPGDDPASNVAAAA